MQMFLFRNIWLWDIGPTEHRCPTISFWHASSELKTLDILVLLSSGTQGAWRYMCMNNLSTLRPSPPDGRCPASWPCKKCKGETAEQALSLPVDGVEGKLKHCPIQDDTGQSMLLNDGSARYKLPQRADQVYTCDRHSLKCMSRSSCRY